MTSVKEADVVDVAESVGPADRLHDLLLAMTGRVDDDAVNSAREMLGVGQLDAAAEFLAGCLLAGRIPVASTEQHHLRRILGEARSDQALADRLHVVEALPADQHRFSDQNESDADLLAALGPIAGRLGGVRALWCAWRVTPAGVTYGAVPQRVLLAEVGPDGSVAAAGYQLIEALRRAGIGCSVEVFNSGADLPEYHRNALASARRVHLDMSPVAANRSGANRARAPRASSSGDSGGGNDLPSEPPVSTAEPAPDPVLDARLPGTPVVAESIPEPTEPERTALAGLGEEPAPVAHEPAVPHEPVAHEPDVAHGSAVGREPAVTRGSAVEEPAVEEPAVGHESAGEHRAESERFDAQRGTEPVNVPDLSPSEEDVRDAEAGPAPEPGSAEPDVPSQEDAGQAHVEQDYSGQSHAEQADAEQDSKNMRVPAAVDAKLTNRERNLLRKLHEELAQREQDRDGNDGEQRQETWSSVPGTGGFPPMGAGSAPTGNQAENKQP